MNCSEIDVYALNFYSTYLTDLICNVNNLIQIFNP